MQSWIKHHGRPQFQIDHQPFHLVVKGEGGGSDQTLHRLRIRWGFLHLHCMDVRLNQIVDTFRFFLVLVLVFSSSSCLSCAC